VVNSFHGCIIARRFRFSLSFQRAKKEESSSLLDKLSSGFLFFRSRFTALRLLLFRSPAVFR